MKKLLEQPILNRWKCIMSTSTVFAVDYSSVNNAISLLLLLMESSLVIVVEEG